jgi:putative restriction endonuclease
LTPTKLKALHYYSRKFQTIRVDRIHGVAPHKPILLLTVIELFRNGEMGRNEIYLSHSLNCKFLKYWSYLGSELHNPDISSPYFHMRSGKFWHLMANPGYEKIISSKIKLKTFAEVKRAVKFAYLDEDLFDLLQVEKYRNSFLLILISRWFPGRFEEIERIATSEEFNPRNIFLDKIRSSYLRSIKDS